MGMFAVKNDNGEWLSFDPSRESLWYTNNPTFFNDKSYAEAQNTGLDGSRVVELIELPEKIVVSEDEAEMLEQAKDDYCAASVISAYSTEHIGAMGQDRLLRAYVIGWVVEKPKLWNVKVPHTRGDYYCKFDSDNVESVHGAFNGEKQSFTIAEIEHYGLQDCEKVEVKQDEI